MQQLKHVVLPVSGVNETAEVEKEKDEHRLDSNRSADRDSCRKLPTSLTHKDLQKMIAVYVYLYTRVYIYSALFLYSSGE